MICILNIGHTSLFKVPRETKAPSSQRTALLEGGQWRDDGKDGQVEEVEEELGGGQLSKRLLPEHREELVREPSDCLEFL